ncbi:MAG: tRNA lysidine(34) synthetase TilS, partial [Anaerolineales bacterium]
MPRNKREGNVGKQPPDVSDMLETVRLFIDREQLFVAGEKILVAVSGGADSLCLLSILQELRYELAVAHFDHRLRPESGREGQAVRKAAGKLRVPFLLGQGDVRRHAGRHRLTLEEAARDLRYGFLRKAAEQAGAKTVAAGHTMDDQAETVLLHLMRGTGVRGLGGMRPAAPFPLTDRTQRREDLRLARPLLCLTHAQTVAYCRQTGWTPAEDSSNRDTTYTRNRIRRDVLPLLAEYNPSIVEKIFTLSGIARDQNDYLESVAAEIWDSSGSELEPGLVRIPVAVMQSAPRAVQQALVRHAIREAAGSLHDLAFRHVQQVLTFLQSPTKSRKMDLAIGVDIAWENEWLVFRSLVRLPECPKWEGMEIPIPGTAIIRHPDWEIRSQWKEARESTGEDIPQNPWTAKFNPDRLHLPLVLHRRKLSERFHPSGMPGPVKLGNFLASHHMPFSDRDRWPLVCDTNGIGWIPGCRLRVGR